MVDKIFKNEKIRHTLCTIANVLTFLIALVALIVSITSMVVRSSLSEKTMKDIVATIDVNSEDTTIDEWIYMYFESHYDSEYLIEFMVTQEAVASVLDNTDFTSFVADKLIDYSQDILYNTGTGVFSSDEFMDFIEANELAISEATGRYYIPGEFDIMREYFLTMDMFDDITASAICRKIGVPVEKIRLIAAEKTTTMGFVIMGIALALMFALNYKKIHSAISRSGAIAITVGALYIIIRYIFTAICEGVAHRIGMGASLVNNIASPVTSIIGTHGFILAGIGIALVLSAIGIEALIRHFSKD